MPQNDNNDNNNTEIQLTITTTSINEVIETGSTKQQQKSANTKKKRSTIITTTFKVSIASIHPNVVDVSYRVIRYVLSREEVWTYLSVAEWLAQRRSTAYLSDGPSVRLSIRRLCAVLCIYSLVVVQVT